MSFSDEQLLMYARGEKDESERRRYTDELISRYSRYIAAKASRMKNARVDAEDLVSEGFLGLLGAIRAYSAEKGDFAPFAGTCIANRMKTAVARHKDEPLPIEDFDLAEVPEGKPQTEELVIEMEQQSEIEKTLSAVLSERESEVFGLYLRSLSYQQIAEKLKISVKSVDNALSRARAKLKKQYFDKN